MFWKSGLFTTFCFSSPFPPLLNVGSLWTSWLSSKHSLNQPANIDLKLGVRRGEGVFWTRVGEEMTILNVWKMGLLSRKTIPKSWSCVLKRSSQLKVHTKYLTLSVYTKWGFSKIFLEKIIGKFIKIWICFFLRFLIYVLLNFQVFL